MMYRRRVVKKVFRRLVPRSLQRRFKAAVLKHVLPKVYGDLNLAFGVGDDHLFMDGWLAGPGGQIAAVLVPDERGKPIEVPFTVYQYVRADVVTALKDTVPAGFCSGYRLLIECPPGGPKPDQVKIQLASGVSYEQRIDDGHTASLRRAWKIEQLSTTPEYYGLPQPLVSNPVYKRLILAPAGALLERQTFFEGCVDGWYRCDDGSVLIFGWIDDDGKTSGTGSLRNHSTNEKLPAAEMFRYHRADLQSSPHELLGMLLFIAAPVAGPPPNFVFRSEKQGDVFLRLKESHTRGEPLLDLLLSIYDQCRSTDVPTAHMHRLSATFIPTIESLHRELQEDVFVAEEVRLGRPVPRPDVSIVIPLYKAYELTQQQLADFSIDPFVAEQDIIFVLDAPEDRKQVKFMLHRLHDLYRVPVRVLVMKKNGGFGWACNAGATAASAPYLLFLNSDVFPQSPGWLTSMLSRLKADRSIGAVGPRLLFPDESIQHVGMTWRRLPGLDHQLVNDHPWKGMDPSLVPQHHVVEVPAVTAAALLCRTDEFHSVGMFDVGYIRGDFEDSDLCLKLRERGQRVVCDNDAVLYHVEGNSYPSAARRKVFFYNAMRHELRWGETIARLTDGSVEVGRGEEEVARDMDATQMRKAS